MAHYELCSQSFAAATVGGDADGMVMMIMMMMMMMMMHRRKKEEIQLFPSDPVKQKKNNNLQR